MGTRTRWWVVAAGTLLAAPASAQEPPIAPVAPEPSSAPTPAPQAPPMPPPMPPPIIIGRAAPAAPPVAPLALAPAPPVSDVAPPSNGLALLLVGSGLLVAGVANVATSPLCLSSSIRVSAHTACLGTSLAFGVAFLGAGIPLVVVGALKRAAWVEWSRRGGVMVMPSGAAATWTMTW